MNTKLVSSTAVLCGEDPAMVRDIIGHVSRFTSEQIRSGDLKDIRWPLLGKFAVNWPYIAYLNDKKSSPTPTEKSDRR